MKSRRLFLCFILLPFLFVANGCIYFYEGYVEGKVVDESGNPIEGAAVSVNGVLTTTNEYGCFFDTGSVHDDGMEIAVTKLGRDYVTYNLSPGSHRIEVTLSSKKYQGASKLQALNLNESEKYKSDCSKIHDE